MEKTAEAFRTISEVADWLELPTHVLRFWESQFSQIKPVKRAGGRRYYRPKDMLLIGGIKKLLHEDGESIKAAKKILNKRGVKYVAALSETPNFMKDRGDQVAARPSDDAPNIAAIEDVNVSAERLIDTSTKVIPLPLPKLSPCRKPFLRRSPHPKRNLRGAKHPPPKAAMPDRLRFLMIMNQAQTFGLIQKLIIHRDLNQLQRRLISRPILALSNIISAKCLL